MSATVAWPAYAVALAVVVAIAWWRFLHPPSVLPPQLRDLLLLLAAPLLLLAWTALMFGVEHDAPPRQLGRASGILTAIALAILSAVIWVMVRWRSQWYLALPTALVALVGTAFTWFIGAMAIADDWI